MSSTILIIDDEEKLRQLLARILQLEGYQLLQAGNLRQGLQSLQQQEIDVVICDVKLPDGSGVEAVQQIREKSPLTEIILLTAYGNIPDSVKAIKNGAFDYITKGDDNDKIIPLVARAEERVQMQRRITQLEARVGKQYAWDSIIGKSASLRQAIALARKVADTPTTVLLTGETGTGKEVFAQAIHQESSRKNKPFVAINCSAFSKELLESEIFGHKAGAFTGATKDKKGLIEEAQGGTLFLDEIGEMPMELQAKLLRVLESKEFIKVGDTKTLRVDVRIIAATNRDLAEEVKTGHFREDLLYRLNVFTIELPPLRSRKDDIPALANHYLEVFSSKTNRKGLTLDPQALSLLEAHEWKGNIRELKNVLERAVILAEGGVLSPEDLPLDIQMSVPHSAPHVLSAFDLASVEKLHIQRVLNHTKWNKAEAARLLNIGLTTLYRKIDEYKLDEGR
ncbi:sigma-54-dependent transcriptional regulator [Dinghuibacter silviterrae]|uniref:DNA-binding NtrC family response regulator n=1 Tax=Dinghuibacter silviterrae TaxID=1539049 RepID=A0A4R8DGT7_9BACT|nr:sigma-54 dependent transcriptional regulator [Dinghuibacter silviterrae]TDW96454.1 DNA-binding NtrC family response regulator [Dinghuibacter silviterrae]